MIVWLSQGVHSIWLRVLVTVFVFGWLVYIAWSEHRHYRVMTEVAVQQFEALRQDNRDMQALMKANTAKFTGTIDRNTRTIEEVHGKDGK